MSEIVEPLWGNGLLTVEITQIKDSKCAMFVTKGMITYSSPRSNNYIIVAHKYRKINHMKPEVHPTGNGKSLRVHSQTQRERTLRRTLILGETRHIHKHSVTLYKAKGKTSHTNERSVDVLVLIWTLQATSLNHVELW